MRAYEHLIVHDDVAYVSSWGSGLVMLDVSDPYAPTQLGMFASQYIAAAAVQGTTAVLGRVTNGGAVLAVDVSNPAMSALLNSVPENKSMRLRA